MVAYLGIMGACGFMGMRLAAHLTTPVLIKIAAYMMPASMIHKGMRDEFKCAFQSYRQMKIAYAVYCVVITLCIGGIALSTPVTLSSIINMYTSGFFAMYFKINQAVNANESTSEIYEEYVAKTLKYLQYNKEQSHWLNFARLYVRMHMQWIIWRIQPVSALWQIVSGLIKNLVFCGAFVCSKLWTLFWLGMKILVEPELFILSRFYAATLPFTRPLIHILHSLQLIAMNVISYPFVRISTIVESIMAKKTGLTFFESILLTIVPISLVKEFITEKMRGDNGEYDLNEKINLGPMITAGITLWYISVKDTQQVLFTAILGMAYVAISHDGATRIIHEAKRILGFSSGESKEAVLANFTKQINALELQPQVITENFQNDECQKENLTNMLRENGVAYDEIMKLYR